MNGTIQISGAQLLLKNGLSQNQLQQNHHPTRSIQPDEVWNQTLMNQFNQQNPRGDRQFDQQEENATSRKAFKSQAPATDQPPAKLIC